VTPAGAQAATELSRRPPVRGIPIRQAGAVIAGAGLSGVAVALGADYALFMVLAVLGLATFVVLLAWPQLALPVAVFLIWTSIPTLAVDQGAPRALAAAIPLILVAPLARSVLRREALTVDRTFLYMLVLLGIFVVSTIFGSELEASIDQTVTLVIEGIVLYFLVFNAARTPTALRHAVWAILAAGAFLAAITVFQNLTQTFYRPYFGFSPLDIQYFIGKGDTPRAYGPVGDPNYYAQILVATIGLGLPFLWRQRARAIQLFAGANVAVMALALAFTYSRGGMLALAIMITAMVFLGYLKLRHLVAMVLAAAVLISVVPGYRERIESLARLGGVTAETGASNEADEAARSRLTENITAALVFLDYPVLGVGPGGFGYFYQEYAARTGGPVHRSTRRGSERTAPGEAPKREAHNIFLSAAAETGILGLLALCAVLGTAFRQLLRARRAWRDPDPGSQALMTGLLLALIGYVAAGLFLTLAFERYLWLLLALMGAAAFVARERATRPQGAGSVE
jgi:putative inorganic carbon (hco3(-)) transporter